MHQKIPIPTMPKVKIKYADFKSYTCCSSEVVYNILQQT